MNGLCGNCEFFRPQSDAINEKQKSFLKEFGASAYGKCKATFVDKDGNPQTYDIGTVNVLVCSATDDRGKFLFSPLIK